MTQEQADAIVEAGAAFFGAVAVACNNGETPKADTKMFQFNEHMVGRTMTWPTTRMILLRIAKRSAEMLEEAQRTSP